MGLAHLRNHLPQRALHAAVPALVLPHLRYCLAVYDNGSKSNTSQLQKIINFAAKVIIGRKKFGHVSDPLQRLGWLSAGDMAIFRTNSLAHSMLSGGEPERLASVFIPNSPVRERHTRRDHMFRLPRPRSVA